MATLKASVLPFVIWFFAIQLFITSFVNSSGFLPSSIRLNQVHKSSIKNQRGPRKKIINEDQPKNHPN